MVERQLPKLHTRVRFPSPAPALENIDITATGYGCRLSAQIFLNSHSRRKIFEIWDIIGCGIGRG
jgi:hypothetical protein